MVSKWEKGGELQSSSCLTEHTMERVVIASMLGAFMYSEFIFTSFLLKSYQNQGFYNNNLSSSDSCYIIVYTLYKSPGQLEQHLFLLGVP